MTETAYKHRDDPVLVLAKRFPKESAGWAWFGIHAPEDPTYEADGWKKPFRSAAVWAPAWRGDVLRVVWKGPFTLPDEQETSAPSAIDINRKRWVWLHCHLSEKLCFAAGTPLSQFVERMGELAEVYVPIVGVGERTWREWDSMRAAAFKAGRYAE